MVGDSCIDVYNYGTCDRISPEAPVPILKIEKSESKPGMALNVATNLNSLGNETTIITNLEEIRKERYVCSRNMQHILRVDRGEREKIEPLRINSGFDAFDDRVGSLEDYDCLVISDYNKGFLPSSACRDLVDLARHYNKPIFVDTKKTDLTCFEGCVIKLNQSEYEKITKYPTNCEMVTTLGAMGAMYRDDIYSTVKTEVFDVCGAGDTFLSAFVTHYMSFSSISTAIDFANKVAAISVQKFGNYAPSLGEVS